MPFKEKTLDMDRLNNQILGAFIRFHRESENMSLGFMAETVKITKAYLSDIEHGKRMPQPYTLRQIFSVLDVCFHDDLNIKIFLEEKLHVLYKYYIEIDEENESKIYEDETLFNSVNEYSFGFLQFYLIKFIKAVRTGKGEETLEYYKNILDTHIDFLCVEDKNIYYDILGLEALQNKKYDTALTYLNKGLQAPTKLTTPMIQYHLCITYQKLNRVVEALSSCLKSLELFNDEYTFFRIIYLIVYKANCYSRLHLFSMAQELYLTALEKSVYDKTNELRRTILNNMAWNALKEKNYVDSIKYTEMALESGSTFTDIYVYLPLSYYYLEHYDKCKKAIETDYAQLPQDTYHIILLNALMMLISNERALGIEKLQQCLTMEVDYEMNIYILGLICEVLEGMDDYKKLSVHQKYLLEYFV